VNVEVGHDPRIGFVVHQSLLHFDSTLGASIRASARSLFEVDDNIWAPT
jgi:hypothetical protein